LILLLNTLIILIKPIVLVYNVLLMEGRWNVWSPWYLMLHDKPRKVECKFCSNVISYHKDKKFFHLGYWYDGNGQIRVAVCSKTHPHVKALFAQCDGLVPPQLNDMEVPTHILDGWTKGMAIEMLNPLVEGEFASMFQMDGIRIFTPL